MRALIAILAAAFAAPVNAAEIFRAEPITGTFVRAFDEPAFGDATPAGSPVDFTSRPHFRIEGRIVPGDADKLVELLREELPDPNFDWSNDVVVSLNSVGGDFFEGLALADALRGFAVSTFVGPGDQCLSSCAIAFMGGSVINIRRTAPVPSRYVHDHALVGFHAPFSELPSAIQLPEGTPLSAPLMAQITRQFYGQAQAAINEITRRMSNWQLSPDFVFDMLTKETVEDDARPVGEQFILIDTFAKARQTSSTFLTTQLIYPETIGYLDAQGACDYLMMRSTGNWYSFLIGPNAEYFRTPDVITEAVAEPYMEGGELKFGPPRTSGTRFPTLDNLNGMLRLIPGNDPDAFYFTVPNTQGFGISQCSVFRFDDGRWYAKTFNENVHHPANDGVYMGNKVLDFTDPVPVSLHMAAGPNGRWRGGAEVVWTSEPPDDLQGQYPEEIGSITEASFDCNGALDPAAEVICEYPALQAADGRMVALFRLAREKDPDGVLASQRHWVATRDRACRPGRIDRSILQMRESLAECLLMFTQARSRSLIPRI